MLDRYAETRDPTIRASLVEAHLGLAHWAARQFAGRGEAHDDLYQVALLGLLKSIDRYRPDRGSAFTAYAASTMSGELKRHLRDQAWALRPPRGVHDRHLRVRAAIDGLTQELRRSPTVAEIAARSGLAAEDVVEASDAGGLFRHESLDGGPGAADGDDRTARLRAPGDGFSAADVRADLAPLVARLRPRERAAVHLRFVHDLTQSQIAELLGVSQMEVSRILSRSLARLRSWYTP